LWCHELRPIRGKLGAILNQLSAFQSVLEIATNSITFIEMNQLEDTNNSTRNDMDLTTTTTTETIDVNAIFEFIARTGRIDRPWIEVRNIIETRIIEVCYYYVTSLLAL